MARKNTVWGARHSLEQEEIERIINEFQNMLNITITKLEASVILAERSKSVFWNKNKSLDTIKRLRGII